VCVLWFSLCGNPLSMCTKIYHSMSRTWLEAYRNLGEMNLSK
jgi:hypothetical protein